MLVLVMNDFVILLLFSRDVSASASFSTFDDSRKVFAVDVLFVIWWYFDCMMLVELFDVNVIVDVMFLY